jgi:hypothetical protein
MAMACLRLLCSPCLRCFISVSTSCFAFGPYFALELERFFAVVVRFFVLPDAAAFVFARVDGRELETAVLRLRDEADADFFFAEVRGPALLRDLVAEDFFAFARGDFFAFRDVVPFAGILFPLELLAR